MVCLYLSDIDKIDNTIEEAFEVIERDDKVEDSEKDRFGYMARHLIVRPSKEDMLFEIQVRTISQDAWASISHHLDYKTNSIGVQFKRDFHALSGLFYIADKQFSLIKSNATDKNM